MTDRNRGMWTCEVCEREFALMHENRYTVRSEENSGLMAALGKEAEPLMWDAFDCPYCGCQNRVQVRKRTMEKITETTDTVEDACSGCGLSEVCPLARACDERDEGLA